ncbi:uncharacterized protein THITE_2126015 [Thermothielavioides terrestris NRRL 8126]|uniref:Uncharacterized protein n=1 Tax=Thermothielavioides terrestris (strain ATCC 38088 / NRRL 8126) TaxID=578455 RepID=G2QSY9_THETT|nr:uncharacterized protein THITE_2126015 [Thermothielavioides terrestris NRRL 8126]AEO63514.1 hypothetical protein THITE_2126015 [Thermothielavioides terrestris NRRL 8126]
MNTVRGVGFGVTTSRPAAEVNSSETDHQAISTWSHNDSLCQQAIARCSFGALVPAGVKVSFANLAKQAPLSEQMGSRLPRHAMTWRICYEPDLGYVVHTQASRILVNSVAWD